MRYIAWVAACAVGLTFAAADGYAQGGPSRSSFGNAGSPTLSPYLNLARGGNNAFNYYGLVRPQNNVNSALQNLQGQVNANQQAISAGAAGQSDPNAAATGHMAMFMNYGGFFPGMGAKHGGGSSGFGAAASSGGGRSSGGRSSGARGGR